MREYKFRGYTFRATNITTEVLVNRFGETRREIAHVYEIDGLKDAMTRPFLTSLSQCRGFIECEVWRQRRQAREAREAKQDKLIIEIFGGESDA